MTLSVIGHSFRYETENVIRIFFPLEKINVINELPENTDDSVITYLKDGVVGCEVNLFGKKEKRGQSVSGKTEKEQELVLAQLLYDIFTLLTGVTPPWGILTGVRPSKLMRTLIAENGEKEAVRYFSDDLFVTDRKTELALSVAKAEDKSLLFQVKNHFHFMFQFLSVLQDVHIAHLFPIRLHRQKNSFPIMFVFFAGRLKKSLLYQRISVLSSKQYISAAALLLPLMNSL